MLYCMSEDCISIDLREYPQQFASAIAEIYDDLKTSSLGCPVLPETLPAGTTMFEENPTASEVTDLFEWADLGAVYDYLRGCKSLQMPQEWRSLFPVRETVPRPSNEGSEGSGSSVWG